MILAPESTGFPFPSNTARLPSTASASLSAFAARSLASVLASGSASSLDQSAELIRPSCVDDADGTVFLVTVISPLESCSMVSMNETAVPEAAGSFTGDCFALKAPARSA